MTELVAHAATSPGSRAAGDPARLLTTTPPCPAGSRCGSCTNAAGPLASASRSPPSPGRDWARDDDERYRIAATADGGIWLMRTPYPQPVCELAGTRRVMETASKVIGNMWGDEGTSRVQHAWTADPGIARRLTPGRPATSTPAAATWVQIARPRPSPLTPCRRPPRRRQPPAAAARPAQAAPAAPRPAAVAAR